MTHPTVTCCTPGLTHLLSAVLPLLLLQTGVCSSLLSCLSTHLLPLLQSAISPASCPSATSGLSRSSSSSNLLLPLPAHLCPRRSASPSSNCSPPSSYCSLIQSAAAVAPAGRHLPHPLIHGGVGPARHPAGRGGAPAAAAGGQVAAWLHLLGTGSQPPAVRCLVGADKPRRPGPLRPPC